MGCASSKPSSSSSAATSKAKKKGEKSPAGAAKSTSDTQITQHPEKRGSKTFKAPQTNGTTTHHDGVNGMHEKSPLHLKQQAQAERARRLAHHLRIEGPLLHEIDQQRNRVINYLVTSVRRDLNSELIGQNSSASGQNKLADLVLAAANATDNDDLITDVVSRAVLLILNGTAGNTYKDLLDQLKSHQYLCKHQQHKHKICEITVDTIYGALEHKSNEDGSSLREFLSAGNSSPNYHHTPQQQHQQLQQHTPTGAVDDFKGAVLLSRSQAKEVARILFLTDRARPVVHASPNSAHKDAYIVNKQLSDMSEVTVSKREIDEILHQFDDEKQSFEVIKGVSPPLPGLRAKNLMDDFISISSTSQPKSSEPAQQLQPQTVTETRIVIDEPPETTASLTTTAEASQASETTIQYEEPKQQAQHAEVVIINDSENPTRQALNTLAAISALASQAEAQQSNQASSLADDGKSSSDVIDTTIVTTAQMLDSNNNNLEQLLVEAASTSAKNSAENINTKSSSSAQVEQNIQENGELDPTVKQSLLDDRFYNNDAFKTEPPVNGENINDAATVIQAGYKGHLERKETEKTVAADAPPQPPTEVEGPPTPTPSQEETNGQEQENLSTTAEEKVVEAEEKLTKAAEEEAATMIQATFRGYKTRKSLKKSTSKDDENTAKSSVAETPVAETPVAETPVAETPVAETPVAETPVAETPVAETPVAETPVAETPVAETPVAETPVAETPVAETQRTKSSTTETPVTNSPVAESPESEKSSPLINVDLDQAAIKIQATFRGFRTRKQLQTIKGSKEQPEQSDEINMIKMSSTSPDTMTSNTATLEKKKKKRNKKKRKQQVK